VCIVVWLLPVHMKIALVAAVVRYQLTRGNVDVRRRCASEVANEIDHGVFQEQVVLDTEANDASQ
jgi:hypothetical protein